MLNLQRLCLPSRSMPPRPGLGLALSRLLLPPIEVASRSPAHPTRAHSNGISLDSVCGTSHHPRSSSSSSSSCRRIPPARRSSTRMPPSSPTRAAAATTTSRSTSDRPTRALIICPASTPTARRRRTRSCVRSMPNWPIRWPAIPMPNSNSWARPTPESMTSATTRTSAPFVRAPSAPKIPCASNPIRA